MNDIAKNILVYIYICVHISFAYMPGMEFMDHRLCISSTFLDNANCLSIFPRFQYGGTNVHTLCPAGFSWKLRKFNCEIHMTVKNIQYTLEK